MTEEKRDDLKATAESIVHDAERLKQIELRKLALESGDEDEGHELADQAEELAEDIADKARVEKDLADEVADSS